MLPIQQIIDITQAQVLALSSPNTQIQHLLIDSRKLAFPTQSLFFAIQGARHDSHAFVEELYQKGVRNFIVEKPLPHSFPDANILKVNNSIVALQALARHHRAQFDYPVLAITGSNAKSIIKEWLAQLLAKDFRLVKSPKSYNSQVGVPLSLWQMQAGHNLGIFEAGISQTGEMTRLQAMIQPSLGIFSNIGTAHDEGFEHREQKIEEKLQLFKDCQVLFYCQDSMA